MDRTTVLICVAVLFALIVYSIQGYLPPWPAAVIGTVIVLTVVIIIPRRLVKGHASTTEQKGPLELENEYRQTLVQIVGGVAIIVTVYSAFQGYELSRRGQIADRTFKALDMLSRSDKQTNDKAGNESGGKMPESNMDAKVASIYALEQIANEDEASEWPIVETLFNYVRVHAKWSKDAPVDPAERPPDISAILDFMRRRPSQAEYHQKFDYSGCEAYPDCKQPGNNDRDYYRMINFPEVDLRRAFLQDAMMKATRLRDAHLEEAQLNHAHFENSWAEGAHFEDADLTGSYWTFATLRRTFLNRAQMRESHLSNVDFTGANLSCADLTGAVLRNANLSGANLSGARLIGADLAGAKYITTEQLSSAVGDASTQLPNNLSPPHWSIAENTGCPLAVVTLATDPPGANVLVDGRTIAHTPAKFFLKRNGDKGRTLQISLAGYKSIDKEIWPPGGPIRMSFALQKEEQIESY